VTAGGLLDGDARPRLAPHVRLSFDARRDRWVVQAPERIFVPDEIALEILQRCDGRPLAAIIDELAGAFDASREVIAKDVAALIADLGQRGILVP
jgi:pyrroloquinoline quinone biosynthesis protein D